MVSNRQTATFLMRRFEEAGIQPATRHGQNFLIDLNLVQLLVETAELGPQDVVLEVGTGTGSLTALMAQRAATVVTVELDGHLYQLAREELADFDNVVMLHQDALKNKNHFHSRLLETLRQQLRHPQSGEGRAGTLPNGEAGVVTTAGTHIPQRRLKLAANLPYNIATPVISNLLLTDVVPISMTVTIQKELADRIVARPSTKDYGALSIWIQSQCDVRIVRHLPPTVFWPRPKVESAIIHIDVVPEKRARIEDLRGFHTFVRSMFFHRRKYLRRELLSAYKKRLDKPSADRVLDEMGLSGESRAEQLDVETMLKLYRTVQNHLPDSAT